MPILAIVIALLVVVATTANGVAVRDEPRDDVCKEHEQPQQPPPDQPTTPDEPTTPPNNAQTCCDLGFGCTSWPGKADIYLCSMEDTEGAIRDEQSPCCRSADYECESWPGKAAAVICFGL